MLHDTGEGRAHHICMHMLQVQLKGVLTTYACICYMTQVKGVLTTYACICYMIQVKGVLTTYACICYRYRYR